MEYTQTMGYGRMKMSLQKSWRKIFLAGIEMKARAPFESSLQLLACSLVPVSPSPLSRELCGM
jgi:hypothetical protein